ncbi:FAD-dependent monooxygenase [Actinokineospora globicatena]|uniref:FAD-dependent monooxygenase n=1 Tax=Actinokineospora globicatena TaxID=103729 RepID=UPI0020A4A759|nr:FAD-dependent monooxygenase [Actinokineospora globicatena]MCP2303173.1 3-(3-hydroxy-phenyl)propionate hydroxylase [Actinokineospora globicatena]GLW79710.1 hypothetical protein Aglo01_41910 [Actinokineospora globicatena]GLW85880.1 hypothetical protein Aglo02_35200 [Actinokineospora globicatena]
MSAAQTSDERAAADGDVDVLVVGAGPSGLLTACELLRRGARVRVVDRAAEPSTTPKALSVWPRALDILTDLGLGESVDRESVPITALSYFADRAPLARFELGPDVRCNTLPQHVTERLLTERLHALGGKVERGVRLLALDGVDGAGGGAPPERVTALLLREDGAVERAQASYVVGADGAGSAVRGQLGVGFEGSTYEMAFALVDGRIDGALPPDETLFYQGANGALVIVPLPGGVFRFLSIMPPGQAGVTVPMMQAIIDDRGPAGVVLREAVWQAVFRVHARVATSFHRNRVFLVGDAAHVHSPAGGQGMNNGLQDAHNLAWKLAAVLRGDSPPSLLDSYDHERREVTARILRDTDLQTRAWVVNTPAATAVRDSLFRFGERSGAVSRYYAPVMAGRRIAYHPVRRTQRPSGFALCRAREHKPGAVRVGGVLPRGFALSTGIGGEAADPHAWVLLLNARPGDRTWLAVVDQLVASRPRVATRLVEDRRGFACGRTGYVLVRPDGHVAAHGHRGDLDRLAAELDTAFGPAPRVEPGAGAG